MRERGILFSATMVRALLAGTKTQTRRALSPQPPETTHQVTTWHHPDPRPHFFAWTDNGEGGAELADGGWCKPCPYGAPGDRLWVRERLGYCSEYGHYFAADRTFLCSLFDDPEKETGYSYECSMREASVPSIHLPRRWSRITLEVTEVRVERLHEISEADAKAEGVAGHPDGPWHAYQSLWTLINGPSSWDANPWVWVVGFKRVEVAHA
jgi:hypothetical protein